MHNHGTAVDLYQKHPKCFLVTKQQPKQCFADFGLAKYGQMLLLNNRQLNVDDILCKTQRPIYRFNNILYCNAELVYWSIPSM